MGRFVQFNPPDPVRPFNLSARPFPLVLSSYTETGTEKAEERNRNRRLKKIQDMAKASRKRKKGWEERKMNERTRILLDTRI